MKIRNSLRAVSASLILAMLVLPFASCTPGGTDTTGALTGSVTEDGTSMTDTQTDAATTSDGTIAPVDDDTLSASIPLIPGMIYKEAETTKDGEASYGGIGLTVSYTSTFYGHDSAINRDFVAYASRFDFKKPKNFDTSLTEYYIAELNGDCFGDLIWCKNGKLYVSLLTVTSKTAEGSIFVADSKSAFTFGTPTEYEIGEGARLCGAADFNNDRYSDLLFYTDGCASVYYGSSEGYKKTSYPLTVKGQLFCGDVDGDGSADLLDIDGCKVTVYYCTGSGFSAGETKEIYMQYPYEKLSVADMNSDTRADIVALMNDGEDSKVLTWFGLGDGTFGPGEGDDGNTNLYGLYTCKYKTSYIAAGDLTGDTAGDVLTVASIGGNTSCVLLVSRDEPAYDYSLFGMKIGDKYYMYSGCRWYDTNLVAVENGDGDHVILSTSDDGVHWKRYLNGPMFYLGWELGESDWWTDNTLEPEVLYVDGVYHMYWQCSYATPKGNYGDKIGYATSTDGVNWTRKTDESAVICVDPEIGFNHEEVIYVPDDPDGKPYWMYVGHFVNGGFQGYVRIRSSDPTKFLYSEHESTSGFGEIGNQIGYVDDPTLGRVFMRITFTTVVSSGVSYSAPTFQISRDGITFVSSKRLTLAAVNQDEPLAANNSNVYFLGLVTENGTGKINANADGSYTVTYLCTTCDSPTAPEIFNAEGGCGTVTFTLSAAE